MKFEYPNDYLQHIVKNNLRNILPATKPKGLDDLFKKTIQKDISDETKHQNNENDFQPIAKLFLTGSDRVITPWPLQGKQSWLDESPKTIRELFIEGKTVHKLAEAFNLDVDSLNFPDVSPLLYQEINIDDENSHSPIALYGKIETNGNLSVLAFFGESEDQITKTSHATVSNFEVDWMLTPLFISPEKTAPEDKTARSKSDNQAAQAKE